MGVQEADSSPFSPDGKCVSFSNIGFRLKKKEKQLDMPCEIISHLNILVFLVTHSHVWHPKLCWDLFRVLSKEGRVQPRRGVASHKLLCQAPRPVSAAAVGRETGTGRGSAEWETCSGLGQPSRRIPLSPAECKGSQRRAGQLGWERAGRGKAPGETKAEGDTEGTI